MNSDVAGSAQQLGFFSASPILRTLARWLRVSHTSKNYITPGSPDVTPYIALFAYALSTAKIAKMPKEEEKRGFAVQIG